MSSETTPYFPLQLSLQYLKEEVAVAARMQARATLAAALLNNKEFVDDMINGGFVGFDKEHGVYAYDSASVDKLRETVDLLMEHVVMKGIDK